MTNTDFYAPTPTDTRPPLTPLRIVIGVVLVSAVTAAVLAAATYDLWSRAEAHVAFATASTFVATAVLWTVLAGRAHVYNPTAQRTRNGIGNRLTAAVLATVVIGIVNAVLGIAMFANLKGGNSTLTGYLSGVAVTFVAGFLFTKWA